jgi:hypothetical protein
MSTLSSIITPTNITTATNTQTLTNKTLTGAVMNGTVGATTPSTGEFTSVTLSPWVAYSPAATALRLTGTQANNTIQGYDGTNNYHLTLYSGANATVSLQSAGSSHFTNGIYNTPIGTGGASTGAFTTLSATGQLSGKGTATNDNAAAGYIGEYVSSSVAQASSIPAVLNTAVNITSISLTAGDWDVDGMVYYLPDGSTAWDLFLASVSTTSATQASRDTGGQGILKVSGGFGTGISSGLYAPMRRISIASTTTVYLVGTISFSAGSPTMYGTIRARRMR